MIFASKIRRWVTPTFALHRINVRVDGRILFKHGERPGKCGSLFADDEIMRRPPQPASDLARHGPPASS